MPKQVVDVAAIQWTTTDIEAYYAQEGSRLRLEYLREPIPASVVVEGGKLARPEWKVELLATVVVPD
jgi:enamine deaminase RidA (YjgF/YER057c/UK114 family)